MLLRPILWYIQWLWVPTNVYVLNWMRLNNKSVMWGLKMSVDATETATSWSCPCLMYTAKLIMAETMTKCIWWKVLVFGLWQCSIATHWATKQSDGVRWKLCCSKDMKSGNYTLMAIELIMVYKLYPSNILAAQLTIWHTDWRSLVWSNCSPIICQQIYSQSLNVTEEIISTCFQGRSHNASNSEHQLTLKIGRKHNKQPIRNNTQMQ